jgi:hypothetical protein
VCRLKDQYPRLAKDFLSKVGAVKTFAEMDAQSAEQGQRVRIGTVISLKCVLPEDRGFMVTGDESITPLDLWKGTFEDSSEVRYSGSDFYFLHSLSLSRPHCLHLRYTIGSHFLFFRACASCRESNFGIALRWRRSYR